MSLTGAGWYSTLNVLKVSSGQEGGGEVRSGISGDLQGRLRFPGGDTSRSLISAVGISDSDRLRCHADIDLPEGKKLSVVSCAHGRADRKGVPRRIPNGIPRALEPLPQETKVEQRRAPTPTRR